MTIKSISIFDLDGCTIDSSHRYRTITDANGIARIDLAHWRANEHLAIHDSLLPLAEQYKADLQSPDKLVIVATAREMHGPDYQFISEQLGEPYKIISRPHGSNLSGGLLKVMGLRGILFLKQFRNCAVTVYEDNATYLKTICDAFAPYHDVRGVYIPSKQGH